MQRTTLNEALTCGVAGNLAPALPGAAAAAVMGLPYPQVFTAGGDAADRARHEWSMRMGRALAVHIVAYLGRKLLASPGLPQPFTYWREQLLKHFSNGGSPALSSVLMLKCVFGGSIRYLGIQHANSKTGWGLITHQAGGSEQLQALQQVRAMSGDAAVHICHSTECPTCVTSNSQEAADYLNNKVLRPGEPRRQWDQWCLIYGTEQEKRSDEWQRSHVLLRTLRWITFAAVPGAPPPAAHNVPLSALKRLGHGPTGLGTASTASAWAAQLPAASAHKVYLRQQALAELEAGQQVVEQLRVTAARENVALTFAGQAKKMEAEWLLSDELASTSPTSAELVAGAKTAMRERGHLVLAAASGGGLGDECRAVDGDGWEMLEREAEGTRFARHGALRGRIAGVDALECVPPSCPPCARPCHVGRR